MAVIFNVSSPSLTPEFVYFISTTEQLLNNMTTDDVDCPVPSPVSKSAAAMFYSVFSAIFAVGLIGNSLLILIFIRQPSMRTIPNTYIFTLAIADLLTVISCVFGPLASNAEHNYPLLCKFFQVVLEWAMGISSFTLIALSIERYYAIVHPFDKKMASKKVTLRIVILIWVSSTVIFSWKMFLLTLSKCAPCMQMFNPASFANSFTVLDLFILYVIPLVVITYFYVLIARELYFKGTSVYNKTDGKDMSLPNHLRLRKKIAGVVLILVVMFAVCYFPINFMSIKLYLADEETRKQPLSDITNIIFCVGCLHNCFNPVVMYILSKSFRGHFNNYLFYCVGYSSVSVEEENGVNQSAEGSKKSTSTSSYSIKV